MLVLNTWEDTCGLTQLQDNALNMYAMGFASQSIQTYVKLVHNGCYDSLFVFFNAPEKLPNHKVHRDVNFHFLFLFLMCSRKSSRIRSIFHTGDSSEWDIIGANIGILDSLNVKSIISSACVKLWSFEVQLSRFQCFQSTLWIIGRKWGYLGGK